MDLNLYFRVLWRFKVIVAAGLLLALVLAFLSFANVKLDGLPPSVSHRQAEQWESLATIGVASGSFEPGSVLTPETRGLLEAPQGDETASGPAGSDNLDPAEFASFGRLMEVTVQAMALATSDPVKRIMEKGGPIDGALADLPVNAGDSQVPFITFSAIAATRRRPGAERAPRGGVQRFFSDRQAAAEIPRNERVVIETANAPQSAVLLEGRKKTRPIIVFLTVMTAVLGLCFVLENVRPRVREVPPTESRQVSSSRSRGRSRRRTA